MATKKAAKKAAKKSSGTKKSAANKSSGRKYDPAAGKDVERDEIAGRRGASYWWRWRRALFAFMFRNSAHALDRFGLPADSLVEIGRRIEM